MHNDLRLHESEEAVEIRRREEATVLVELYGIPRDVANRIVAMAKNIDQAHAIASLMK